ncbi:hypothetical protein BDN71DRAFT_1432905 [Pleurotus eryngii]|uniref:Uncharacterized protein n=1 Tax=Pleurotus eryngii TaxID=5323 RepID=A0A9P5ZSE3_PLEER|nr:hypothetical protein BDN71DRAFT_1432905 [Pleurotus eryngii]
MKCKYDGGIQMLSALFREEHSQCMMLVKEPLAWPVPVQSLEQFTQLFMEQVFTPLVVYHNNRLAVAPVDLKGINHDSFDWDSFYADVLKVAIIGEVRLPQTDIVGRGMTNTQIATELPG